MKGERVRDYIKEQLKDPQFRELWELDQQKLVFIKKIIAHRIKHKLTQTQLAKKLGVSQQHISKIESGDFSNIDTLHNVLLAIGYTVRIQMIPLKSQAKNRLARYFAKHRASLK